MDSIKAQKLQAMKTHKKAQLLYSLTAFLSSLFYLYLFWFPSMNHFFFAYIPDIYSFFQSPKFLFLLGNVIVVILVGESKLSGSHSSPAAEIYDEYVERSRRFRERSRPVVNVEYYKKKDQSRVEMHKNKRINMSTTRADKNMSVKEKKKEILMEPATTGNIEHVHDKYDHRVEEEEKEDQEELEKLDNLELNRRVEEFIARVNRQRMLEATQIACNGD